MCSPFHLFAYSSTYLTTHLYTARILLHAKPQILHDHRALAALLLCLLSDFALTVTFLLLLSCHVLGTNSGPTDRTHHIKMICQVDALGLLHGK